MGMLIAGVESSSVGGTIALSLGFALAAVASVLLLLAAYRQRGTTLVAPILWMVVSIALWAFAGANCLFEPMSGSPPKNCIGVQLSVFSSFCPAMAVLGAKRPQNRAWGLVVVSLVVILLLPSLPSLLGKADQRFGHWLMQWFLGALVIFAWLNHLPTRYGIAATILAVGQGAWVLGGLPIGFWLTSLSAIVAVACGRFWPIARRSNGWNRVWLDFRDSYGVVWGLRVMERMNALANAAGSDINLEWSGFYVVRNPQHAAVAADSSLSTVTFKRPESEPATTQQIEPIEAGLRNLLLKFVSSEWIDARLHGPPSQLVD